MTTKSVEMVLEHYRRGDLLKIIAHACQCSQGTIRKIARDHGEPCRRGRTNLHPRTKEIITDYCKGVPIRDIAQRYDCDCRTVSKIARRNNLPKRNHSNGANNG